MMKIILSFMVFMVSLNAAEIYATFSIQAKKSANLAFYSSGIVDKVFVDVSSKVKKGDKLVELQNDDLRASLRMAKAKLKNAEVSLKFAKKDYDRQLLIKDLIDEAKFDKYLFTYESANVALSSAKANLAYQQSLLDRTLIKAPFDGIIFEKTVEVGDVVSGMMLRTVFKIQSQRDRKLILEFDQKYWKKVKVGNSVKYTVNGDKKVYTGKISKVYPYANSENRKIKAEVKVKNFIVGLFGDGYILVPDDK
ncbi:efflux RND transporter periplasmic adaptor subunit [Sulfurimonas sp.]|uniref:efflux RND transporter periplasmic adaptor subunit n=1 Tax=Sulfurimonas sp. TaxID=2022749 RepID=UPI002B4688F1|nr:efflux RND transporter periplasmic adaptor subunit [Sulfurimonas sp.]